VAQAPPVNEKPRASAASKTEKPAGDDSQKAIALSLDDLLAQALKSNPDIRVAQAKVQEAEADLNRTQLQVTRKVVALHQELEAKRARVRAMEQQFLKMNEQVQKGLRSVQSVEESKQLLIEAKAQLSATAGEISYLVGKSPIHQAEVAGSDGMVRVWDVVSGQAADVVPGHSGAVRSIAFSSVGKPMAVAYSLPASTRDRLRKVLDEPVSCQFENTPLAEVLKNLEKLVSGVSFRIPEGNADLGDMGVTMRFKDPIPLGAVIEALEDSFLNQVPTTEPGKMASLRFVVRDYGILVTRSSALPPGALTVDQFWAEMKSRGGESSTPKKP
jgi:hypothetical protein